MPVRITRTDNDADAKRLGMEALKARQWLEAVNRLGAVLEVDPTDIEALYGIANAHVSLGDTKTARAMLGRAIEVSPDFRPAHLDMATLLAHEGRVLESVDSAIRAVELDPFDPEAVTQLSKIRGMVAQLRPASKKKGKKQRQTQGPAQSQIDAALSRINSALNHASHVRSGAVDDGRRPTLSVCMITRNEEEFIGECLESVKGLADEVIVVDTGSRDNTLEIAVSHGATVYKMAWPDSYSDARNESLGYANSDWILVLDADERVDKGSRDVIMRTIRNANHAGYAMHFRNYVGRETNADYFVHRTCRLFRNRPEHRYFGRIHERIVESIEAAGGTIGEIEAVVHHYGYRPEVMAEKGKHERNLRLLLADLEDNPNDPFCMYNLGVQYSIHHDCEDTIRYMEAASRAVIPAHEFAPNVYLHLANAYDELGRSGEAISALDRAEQAAIIHPELYFARGNSLIRLKRYEEAIGAYESAVLVGRKRAWSGDPGAYGHKAYYGVAKAHMALGHAQQALEACQLALSLNPNDAQVHEIIGAAYLALGRSQDAEKHIERSVSLNPNSPEALTRLGDLHKQRKQYREAAAKYSEALAAGLDSAELHLKLGISLQSVGDYAGAEESYRQAMALSPVWPNAYTALGLLYVQQDRIADAMQAFVQAVDADPNYTDAYFHAADALYSTGKYVEASAIYQSGLSYDPSNARAFLSLGNCYFQMGAYDAAALAYRQALALKPDYPEARQNLAQAEQAVALPKAA